MLGLAVDPGYASGRPYVYVLYTYNHVLGIRRMRRPHRAGPPPIPPCHRAARPTIAARVTAAATTDGCVVSGRLSRLTASGGVMSGPGGRTHRGLVPAIPEPFGRRPVFGPEGALYASAGDGASFTGSDYGQYGGTLAARRRPRTRAAIRRTPAGSALAPPTAEGGTLRSQDLRTSGDPVGLDGTIVRVDPDTGLGWPTNARIGDADRTRVGSSPTASATRSASRSGPEAARPARISGSATSGTRHGRRSTA